MGVAPLPLLASFHCFCCSYADESLLAASTDVEHVFLHGGLIISKCCHNLSPESTHANVILNSWSKIDGIVPQRELMKCFNEKLCHSSAKGDVIEVNDSTKDSEEDNK